MKRKGIGPEWLPTFAGGVQLHMSTASGAGYLGVRYNATVCPAKPYQARGPAPGRQHIGYFPTPVDAAVAYAKFVAAPEAHKAAVEEAFHTKVGGIVRQAEGFSLHLSMRSTTGYRGVRHTPSACPNKPYQSRGPQPEKKCLGYFETAVEAAVAYARHLETNDLETEVVSSQKRPDLVRHVVSEANGLALYLSSASASGYLGVQHRPKAFAINPYVAHGPPPEKRYLGNHATALDAAVAYAQFVGGGEGGGGSMLGLCGNDDDLLERAWGEAEPRNGAPPIVTHAEGLQLHLSVRSTTGYLGVGYRPTDTPMKPYQAKGPAPQRRHIGYYTNPVEAAVAYAAYMKEHRIQQRPFDDEMLDNDDDEEEALGGDDDDQEEGEDDEDEHAEEHGMGDGGEERYTAPFAKRPNRRRSAASSLEAALNATDATDLTQLPLTSRTAPPPLVVLNNSTSTEIFSQAHSPLDEMLSRFLDDDDFASKLERSDSSGFDAIERPADQTVAPHPPASRSRGVPLTSPRSSALAAGAVASASVAAAATSSALAAGSPRSDASPRSKPKRAPKSAPKTLSPLPSASAAAPAPSSPPPPPVPTQRPNLSDHPTTHQPVALAVPLPERMQPESMMAVPCVPIPIPMQQHVTSDAANAPPSSSSSSSSSLAAPQQLHPMEPSFPQPVHVVHAQPRMPAAIPIHMLHAQARTAAMAGSAGAASPSAAPPGSHVPQPVHVTFAQAMPAGAAAQPISALAQPMPALAQPVAVGQQMRIMTTAELAGFFKA